MARIEGGVTRDVGGRNEMKALLSGFLLMEMSDIVNLLSTLLSPLEVYKKNESYKSVYTVMIEALWWYNLPLWR